MNTEVLEVRLADTGSVSVSSTKEDKVTDNRLFLKIKLISLADEARTIRRFETMGKPIPQDESRVRPPESIVDGHPFNTQKRPKIKKHYPVEVRHELYVHRTEVVRMEARLTHLAYAFLKGHSYLSLEGNTRTCLYTPQWQKVFAMVCKYGDGTPAQSEAFKAWLEAGGIDQWYIKQIVK